MTNEKSQMENEALLAAFSHCPGPRMKPIVSLAHVQVGDVRVDFGRRNVAVSQQRLH